MSHYQQPLCLILIGCAIALLLGCSQDVERSLSLSPLNSDIDFTGFDKADRVIDIEFPRDHGAHRTFATEWWYIVGIVRTTNQRAFGFQYTLFRNALAPPDAVGSPSAWRTGEIYMAHFAVADIEEQEHVSFERLSRGHPELASVTAEPFRIALGDWELASLKRVFSPLQLTAQSEGYSIDFQVVAPRTPILHGDQGLSWKSPTNASYYYSIPRLKIQGTLTTPEQEFEVSGQGWMDHEWSSGLLDPDYQGWYWLTLHLHSGQDLVLFSLVPKNDGEATPLSPVGLLVDEANQTHVLKNHTWSMTAKRYWQKYPVAWQIQLEDRLIQIDPAIDDQLMQTTIRYWEGVVMATENREVIGEGFLELTGY